MGQSRGIVECLRLVGDATYRVIHLPLEELTIDTREITLINDGDGIAVIGEQSVVDMFIAAEAVPSRELDLPRLGHVLAAGSGTAQAASEIATQSGRWIQLSEKSAQALAKGTPMKGSQPGLSRAILTENGRTKSILEFTSKSPASIVSNPAVLAGAAGLMAQLAMQQTMSEITDYLATIDAKLDDVLRAQKDSVVADMVGVGMVIEEAMVVRAGVGRVSEVTWSKVQATNFTIARTQAYALAQIDHLASKLENENRVNGLADVAKEIDSKVNEWLAILLRCFQLLDATAILELDRVLDSAPEELERHREALRIARQKRRDVIATSTESLMERLDAASSTANRKVLTNPIDSRNVLAASGRIAGHVDGFHDVLGITHEREAVLARLWREAASEIKDNVVDTGAKAADATKRRGGEALRRARSHTSGVAERVRRGTKRSEESDVQAD